MKVATATLALALVAFAVPALSAEHSMDGEKKMEDCKLHRTDLSDVEFNEAQDEMFAMIDTDRDGTISRGEFTSHHLEMRRKHREHARTKDGTEDAHKH